MSTSACAYTVEREIHLVPRQKIIPFDSTICSRENLVRDTPLILLQHSFGRGLANVRPTSLALSSNNYPETSSIKWHKLVNAGDKNDGTLP